MAGVPNQTLENTLIKQTPNVNGGAACVRDTRIAVWTLMQLMKLGRTEAQLLEDFPSLTVADIDAVWAYYRAHPAEIESEITAQDHDE